MWGAIVGGFVGGLVGGPLGAAAGAALGAGMTTEEQAGGLQGDLRYEEDGDGTSVFLLPSGVPDGAFAIMRALDSDGNLAIARSPLLVDEDGYFFALTEVSDGHANFYIPQGAVWSSEGSNLNLAFFLMMPGGNDSMVELGNLVFHIPWSRAPISLAGFWRPLIGLCMAVARSDGVLERAEVAKVREVLAEGLGIPSGEKNSVVQILKEEPSASVESLANSLAMRAPWLEPPDVLEALAEVAKADGSVHPNELKVIREVFDLFGGAPQAWAEFTEAVGLDVADRLAEYRALLGVGELTTVKEIKRAYKKKVIAYHPDKYQNLPEEFQNVARDMTIKLNKARDQLVEHHSR